jgi:hypothetical protein
MTEEYHIEDEKPAIIEDIDFPTQLEDNTVADLDVEGGHSTSSDSEDILEDLDNWLVPDDKT